MDKVLYRNEKRILKISMYAAIGFALAEFIMAIISQSQAILLDAVYDSAELIMIAISIKLLPLLYRPISEKQPYGYSQMESVFVLVKSFMLLSVTLALVFNNLQIMFTGGREVSYGLAAYFEMFATLLSLVIIIIMKRINSRLSSPMVKTEISGWLIDAVSSAGMSIAFFVPLLFQAAWIDKISPYLDQIVAIFLAILVLPYPVKFIISSFRDMFLFAPEVDIMDEIKATTEQILDNYEIESTVFDVIRTGRKLWICIYFKCEEDLISVKQIAQIQDEIEQAILQHFPDVYIELLPDIE